MTHPLQWAVMRRAFASFTIAAAVTLAATLSARACPMCVEQLPSETNAAAPPAADAASPASGGASPQLAEGFYYSILLMLAVPYALALGGGVTIYTLLHRAKKRQALLAPT